MARKKRGRRSRRAAMRKKRQIHAAIILVVAALLCVFIGSYAVLKGYVEKTEPDKISDHIVIGRTDVSGMDKEQALAALRKEIRNDSSVTVKLNIINGSVEVFLKEIGYSCPDLEKLVQQAVDYGKKGNMWRRYQELKALEEEKHVIPETYTVSEKALQAILEEKATPMLQLAENAYIARDSASGARSVVKEKEGETIDVAKSVKAIEKLLNGKWDHGAFSLDLVTKLDKPEIVAEDLEQMSDELGYFYTEAGGGERWTNLKNGSGKINGVIVKPGETFSMCDTVAPFTEENGYAEGTAYENGKVVPSIGGGICQVSTTLYNAVIEAELDVIERHPHSMLVDYVKPSRDAAVAEGVLDFKFKNNRETPIYIFAEINQANYLCVAIYGKETRPENVSVEYESETLSTEDYSVEYRLNTSLAFGAMQYAGSPHRGCNARLWKVVYKDGKEVERTVFNTSSYQKSNQIVEIGTSGGSTAAVSALQTAVASQDINAINAVISGAYSASTGSGE